MTESSVSTSFVPLSYSWKWQNQPSCSQIPQLCPDFPGQSVWDRVPLKTRPHPPLPLPEFPPHPHEFANHDFGSYRHVKFWKLLWLADFPDYSTEEGRIFTMKSANKKWRMWSKWARSPFRFLGELVCCRCDRWFIFGFRSDANSWHERVLGKIGNNEPLAWKFSAFYLTKRWNNTGWPDWMAMKSVNIYDRFWWMDPLLRLHFSEVPLFAV